MSEKGQTVVANLVIGHKADGRCVYSPEAKDELVRRALEPGVSVSKLALDHGLNANLLRRWIMLHQRSSGRALAPVFVPVSVPPSEQKPAAVSVIELEMGDMTIRLRGAVDADALRTVIACLRP